eukprot:Hpha_TRINITY_DN20544_c0_g1::TRINITY_DN20544_c0_g1_i1::g.30747::m.30747
MAGPAVRRFDPVGSAAAVARRRRSLRTDASASRPRVRSRGRSKKKEVPLPSVEDIQALVSDGVHLPLWVLHDLRRCGVIPQGPPGSVRRCFSPTSDGEREPTPERRTSGADLLKGLHNKHIAGEHTTFGEVKNSFMTVLMRRREVSMKQPVRRQRQLQSPAIDEDHSLQPGSLLWLEAGNTLAAVRRITSREGAAGNLALDSLRRVAVRVEVQLRHVQPDDIPTLSIQVDDLARAVRVANLSPEYGIRVALAPLADVDWGRHAVAWWGSNFGPSCYAPRETLLRKFLREVGCWLPTAAAGDPEHSIWSALSHSALASHASSHDFALFIGAFGPLRPPPSIQGHHPLSCLYEVLFLNLMTLRTGRQAVAQSLRGLKRGSHAVYYTSTPGVLGLAAVARGGKVQHYELRRAGLMRWQAFSVVDQRPAAAAGRTIAEAVELMEPYCLPHLRCGTKYVMPWADPRGEVRLWGTPEEANELRQRNDVLRAVASLTAKGAVALKHQH